MPAKSLQSCPTLCDPIDGSPPGSPVPGILQARTLQWVAISFSNAWKWKVKVKLLSCVRLLATPWTAAYQAPQSMGFSRQEYWSGVPLPSPKCVPMCVHICVPTRTSVCVKRQGEKPIQINLFTFVTNFVNTRMLQRNCKKLSMLLLNGMEWKITYPMPQYAYSI